ncbi:uncharacterized protein LOC107618134 [Arachis ipaensis]|uniref:uncharacterized protein LOC107618134 n=1 Tax=Arachis ipaensis TaxID=130454 RepID=UPI000A2B9672|nr:uncharacterized protein LOC107618134 [Arachis ipaensis]
MEHAAVAEGKPVAASFVGSLPPNPSLPPPLKAQRENTRGKLSRSCHCRRVAGLTVVLPARLLRCRSSSPPLLTAKTAFQACVCWLYGHHEFLCRRPSCHQKDPPQPPLFLSSN